MQSTPSCNVARTQTPASPRKPLSDRSSISGPARQRWELAQDKIITEYLKCFSKRCVALEAEAAAAKTAASNSEDGGQDAR